jgi:hypothetical protein
MGEQAHLRIEIDGNEVTLTGTTKGDPTDEKARQYTAWRWSPRAGAFVLPRNLTPGTRQNNIARLVASYKEAGRDVEIEDTGRRLSVAEEREQTEQRLTHRAERHEHRAERLEQESDAQYETSRRLVENIPFGQPILVGHHSERGHRRTLERSARAMDRSVAAERGSQEAARLAEGLKRALERGTPLVTLRNRIDRLEADVRRYTRENLTDLRARAEEELELDRAELAHREEQGAKVWRREDFKPGDRVRYWGGLREVVRVNPKTLSVRTAYSWLDKLTYQDVQGRISAEEWGAQADDITTD